jgi:hypothetical protein
MKQRKSHLRDVMRIDISKLEPNANSLAEPEAGPNVTFIKKSCGTIVLMISFVLVPVGLFGNSGPRSAFYLSMWPRLPKTLTACYWPICDVSLCKFVLFSRSAQLQGAQLSFFYCSYPSSFFSFLLVVSRFFISLFSSFHFPSFFSSLSSVFSFGATYLQEYTCSYVTNLL